MLLATAIDAEFHQLDLRFEDLRTRGKDAERRLLGALAECGQQVPIVVVAATGRFVVIDGYKRVRALRRLGQDTVSVVVWPLTVAEALIAERASRRGEGPSALEHGWLLVELSEHQPAILAWVASNERTWVPPGERLGRGRRRNHTGRRAQPNRGSGLPP